MKKSILVVFGVLWASIAFGQRFGYIDTQVILEKMPEYANAKKELDQASNQWQQELQTRHTALVKKKQDFEAEKVLFTEEMKREKWKEIQAEEQKTQEYQQRVFGFEGLLFQKREDLMRPIQEKIYAVTDKLARKRKISFIFDKSGDLTMIYADPTHDYTDLVLEEMGLKTAP